MWQTRCYFGQFSPISNKTVSFFPNFPHFSLIFAGFYAFYEKWQATGLVKVDTIYDIVLNISLVLVILGGIVFIVSFAGCLGALRENTVRIRYAHTNPNNSIFN